MKSPSALVLLSGGQDSTTCLYWSLQRYERVRALTLLYGQRHRSELGAASRVAAMAGVPHEVLEIPHLGGSALTDGGTIQASGGAADAQAPGGLPTSFVPGRNLVFLALAAARAAALGCTSIVIGVSEADYSGYPDCRGAFVGAMQAAIAAAMPSSVCVAIATPLLYSSKVDTVRLARTLPGCWDALARTITCYRGVAGGCGACPACELRAKGFADAGERDPAVALPECACPVVGSKTLHITYCPHLMAGGS